MANIPTYRRQVATQAMPVPRAFADIADTSALQRGISDVAGATFEIQAKQRQEADTTAVIGADTSLSNWTNDAMFNQDTGVYSKKGQNAINVTGSTLEAYDQQVQQTLAGLNNDAQRKRFQAIAAQRRESLSGQLNRYEYGEHQQYMNDTDAAAISTAIDTATLNFGDAGEVGKQRQKALAIVDSQAQRNGWSPERLEQARIDASSKVLSGAIMRMADGSSAQAKQYYEASKAGLNAEAQLRLSSTIEQAQRREEAEARQRLIEQRQLQAIARAELHDRVQDAQAAYMQGFQFQNPPNKADFEAAYGKDQGGEHYDQFAKVQAIAPAINEFATADPEQRKQILAKFRPAADGTATEGFAEDSQLYQHLVTVGAGLMKQQQQDPGAYVVQYSPKVKQALGEAQQANTPEAWNSYFTAATAEQRRLGVQSPKPLPEAMASQIAATFNSQVASGQGDNAAQQIEAMQQQFGKNFGAVVQQLGNKLPGEAQIIATGVPKDLAEHMASVAPIKDEDLAKGLQQGQAKEIKENVATELTSFAQSLRGQTGGTATYTTTYDAAVRTATAYVLQGMAPDKAAKKVAAGIVNDKYDFFDTYRVPKALDSRSISRGAGAALSEIKGADLMPLPGLKGVTPEENARQLESAVRDNGEWVTNGDETGLTLTLNGYAVRDKDGKLVQRTWQQLQGTGLRTPGTPNPTNNPWMIMP